MPGFLWNLLARRRKEKAVEHEVEEDQMSPPERRFVEESVEDRQADLAAGAHLGGIDPERLLDDGEPRRD